MAEVLEEIPQNEMEEGEISDDGEDYQMERDHGNSFGGLEVTINNRNLPVS